MDNKFYAKLKKFIKEDLIYIVIIILIICLFNIKLPWSIYAPGGLIDVSERINTDEIGENYFLTYVSFIDGTIPSLALGYILPSWDIVKNDDIVLKDEDIVEMNKRERIYLRESISNATYIAYTKSNYTANIVSSHFYITYVFEKNGTQFKVGDEILSYDDNKFIAMDSLNEYVRTKNVGEPIKFKIVRDELIKEIEAPVRIIDGEAKLGIVLSAIYEYDNSPDLEYTYKKSESGSSGGLMIALALYDTLANEDLSRGRRISGTGTIELDGTVGEIGGVKYKLAGAVRKKADIFLVPTANYSEALSLKVKNNYDIEIIEAKDFDQVLEALRNL